MMLECKKHGSCEALPVSPDLKEKVNNSESIEEYIFVSYEYKNEVAGWFLLSVEYAKKYGVSGGTFPLPNDYPDWTKYLVPVCAKCLEECAKIPS